MWSSNRRVGLGLALLSAGLLPACGGSGEQTSSEPAGVLTLAFGGAQPEGGLAALEAEFHARYPKVVIQHVGHTGDETALPGRDVFALYPSGVPRWVRSDDDSGSKLLGLDALATRERWQQAFGEEVLAPVSLDGVLWGVPLALYRSNMMVHNPALLAEAGLDAPPASLDELVAACQALAAAGKVCISLGTQWQWPAWHWILDGIFPAVAGGEHSRRFLRGELSGDDESFVRTLETAATLLEFANDDRDQIDFPEAASRVAAGEAAFHPMADWVKDRLLAEGASLGSDFELAAHPGADGVFVMHTGNLGGWAASSNVSAVEAWFEVVGSEAGQIAFNAPSGSIPARQLGDVTAFDAERRRTIAAFADPSVERIPGMLMMEAVDDETSQALAAFVVDRDVDAAVAWFRENYWRLAPP